MFYVTTVNIIHRNAERGRCFGEFSFDKFLVVFKFNNSLIIYAKLNENIRQSVSSGND